MNDSRVTVHLVASFTIIIYERHIFIIFIVQATSGTQQSLPDLMYALLKIVCAKNISTGRTL